jgi:tRNA(Ile)-lysidine synthase
MDAWEKFKKTIEKTKVVERSDKVLLAVSGGPDSITLMHLFWRLRKTLRIELAMAYLDHGLRKDAAREARMIQRYGEKLDIPVIVRALRVKQAARAQKISLETAGRNLRYQALSDIARETACNKIATGHTANDNAETMLMWLVRGTGVEGLAGVPVCRPGDGDTAIIRPMLSVTRAEIVEYLRRQKLRYSIDQTNYTLDFTRNRMRHQAIPLLESFNPRLIEHLYNLSRILAEENEFLNSFASRAMRSIVRVFPKRITLDLKGFFEYNRIIQSRILKKILPEKRSALHIERLLEWIFSPSRQLNFSRSWQVEKTKNKLIFRMQAYNAKKQPSPPKGR